MCMCVCLSLSRELSRARSFSAAYISTVFLRACELLLFCCSVPNICVTVLYIAVNGDFTKGLLSGCFF